MVSLSDAQLGGNIPSPRIWWFAGDSIYPKRAWSDLTLIDTLTCNVIATGILTADTLIADSLLQGWDLHILNDAVIDSMLAVGDSTYLNAQLHVGDNVWFEGRADVDTLRWSYEVTPDTVFSYSANALDDSTHATLYTFLARGGVMGGPSPGWVEEISVYVRGDGTPANVHWYVTELFGSTDSLPTGQPILARTDTLSLGAADTTWREVTWTLENPVYVSSNWFAFTADPTTDVYFGLTNNVTGGVYSQLWGGMSYSASTMEPRGTLGVSDTTHHRDYVFQHADKSAALLQAEDLYLEHFYSQASVLDDVWALDGFRVNVKNSLSVGGDLSVTGATALDSTVTVDDSVHVTGNALFDGAVTSDSIQADHYTGTDMTLSAWLSLDSLYGRAISVDTLYGHSPIHVMDTTFLEQGVHLADDDSLRIYSDKYKLCIAQASAASGARDLEVCFLEEDGAEHSIYWKGAASAFWLEAPRYRVSGDFDNSIQVAAFSGAGNIRTLGTIDTLRIDADYATGGIILLGGDDKDSIVVQSSDSLVVGGVAYLHEVNVLDIDSAAVYWEEVVELTATDMWAGSSAPAQDIVGVSPTWAFDPSTDEEVHTGFWLNEEYDVGEDLVVLVEWCPTSTGTNTVTWGIEYNVTPIAGTSALDGATSTSIVTQDASGTRSDLQQTLGWTITGTGFAEGSYVGVRVFRDADASETGADDDYAADASLVSLTVYKPNDMMK
jgi:hypothetical protein